MGLNIYTYINSCLNFPDIMACSSGKILVCEYSVHSQTRVGEGLVLNFVHCIAIPTSSLGCIVTLAFK